MKRCSKCGIDKEETEFWVRKNRPSGFNSECKKCAGERRKANKEKNNERHRKWCEKNREKTRESALLYQRENKEKVNEAHRKWWLENGERYSEVRKLKYANRSEEKKEKDKLVGRAFSKLYYKRNPEKSKARKLVSYFINQRGYMSKPKCCSKCKEEKKLEAHHEDYTKPLDVIWMCKSCHTKYHKEKKRE